MSKRSVIPMDILRLLGDCGLLSRYAIGLLPYHSRNLNQSLRELASEKLITAYPGSYVRSFQLTASGKRLLARQYPDRYTPDCFQEGLRRHIRRSLAKGDCSALMRVAGYAVHPLDKPPLPADKPPHSQDAALSPVNAFYPISEIKACLRDADKNGLSYVRAAGCLLTPDAAFRVYYSPHKSFRYRSTGEKRLSDYPHLFRGYLPHKHKAALLIGDREFRCAKEVVMNTLDETRNRLRENKDGALLCAWGLGSPLLYLPMRREAIALARLFRYPGWKRMLDTFVTASLHEDYSRYVRSLFFGEADGKRLFPGADLNLTALCELLCGLDARPTEIICLAWQEEFYAWALERYAKGHIEITAVPGDFLRDVEELLLEGGSDDS